MPHISWLLLLSQQYIFSVFQDVVWEMSLVQCRYETEIFICGIYCREGNMVSFKAGALKVNVQEREGAKQLGKGAVGSVMEREVTNRRQLRLNYAEANFILMAETPQNRPKPNTHTWKDTLTRKTDGVGVGGGVMG